MKIRFQADADLDPDIARGLCRREPAVDFSFAKGVIADATSDLEVLRLSAAAGRVLVSRDVRTMPGHLAEFLRSGQSPGLILIPSGTSISDAIEGLLVVWLAWSAEEMQNQIRWLPRS